jgi:hypothetical protein
MQEMTLLFKTPPGSNPGGVFIELCLFVAGALPKNRNGIF